MRPEKSRFSLEDMDDVAKATDLLTYYHRRIAKDGVIVQLVNDEQYLPHTLSNNQTAQAKEALAAIVETAYPYKSVTIGIAENWLARIDAQETSEQATVHVLPAPQSQQASESESMGISAA
ncbi:MAG: hypothetical protein JWL89_404 [Candidatus Saccharibacteria bacterium]|nr:hypothetical protein [Candidatus Saccharibacteria bacterium]